MAHRHTPSIDELTAQLRVRGQRVTTARRAVLEALLAAGHEHLTAEDLAERIGARHPAIHLSTVYRTLDALAEAELITVARFADKPVTFHLADDVHHHAVCSTCGSTLELAPSVLEPVRRHLLEVEGFHAEPRHLTIPGECRDCRAARGGLRRGGPG